LKFFKENEENLSDFKVKVDFFPALRAGQGVTSCTPGFNRARALGIGCRYKNTVTAANRRSLKKLRGTLKPYYLRPVKPVPTELNSINACLK
jgi:hypothetical protein